MQEQLAETKTQYDKEHQTFLYFRIKDLKAMKSVLEPLVKGTASSLIQANLSQNDAQKKLDDIEKVLQSVEQEYGDLLMKFGPLNVQEPAVEVVVTHAETTQEIVQESIPEAEKTEEDLPEQIEEIQKPVETEILDQKQLAETIEEKKVILQKLEEEIE